ncbi:hypothetical protein JTE90_015914 [Oedothorax gibbosus]|uniref:Ionotropic glutamate receptor L-glutamate and glycine-binding domain-containing protein n=1 Tax=Oedothorax gibbosus TaxID=931172 RepID=A0AAV6TQV7_9ARAC|nr:hypothetical protein JTE90_015914 [Oedothorax gibbosus]
MLYSTSIPTKFKLSIVPTLFLISFNSSLKGYERLSGVDGDFFTIIAQHLGFEYDVVIPEDRQWGRKKNDGNWTGMIGALARREADMAVGLISMDTSRSEVVDFSSAYAMQEENFCGGMLSASSYWKPGGCGRGWWGSRRLREVFQAKNWRGWRGNSIESNRSLRGVFWLRS